MRTKAKLTGVAALTPEEQRLLQQELKEQETLIAGYRRENEKLCADLKAARQALKVAGISCLFSIDLFLITEEMKVIKDTQHLQAEIRTLQDATLAHPNDKVCLSTYSLQQLSIHRKYKCLEST